ncbi:hypothetical protein AB0P17_36565 [Streptomyces sp. NPDC088124]|uniref:hypothetical protein n=1 Tax=Streptomyces sp. NPDC088124 TaxID=3154654 RepID=UPI003449A1EC
MSDDQDRVISDLMGRLGIYAQGIAMALMALPVPMSLPKGDQGKGLLRDFLPAVVRAYEIADEQPIPVEQRAIACTALLHWITAAELTVAYAVSGDQYRADAALLAMMTGEPMLADLIEWLVDPEGWEPPQD